MSRGGSGGGGPVGVALSGPLGPNEMGFGPHPGGGDIKGYYGPGDHMQNYGHYGGGGGGYPDSNGYYDNQMYGNMTEEDHYRSACMPMMEGYCNNELANAQNCGPAPNGGHLPPGGAGNAGNGPPPPPHLSMPHPDQTPNGTHPHPGHHPHPHMGSPPTNGHHGLVHHPMQVLNPNHGMNSSAHHRLATEAPDSVLHPHHSAAAAAAAAAQVSGEGCD